MFTSLFLKSLNREAASRKNRPEEILHHLEIREGHAIADLGSGGGFFTLSFAGRTGKNGKVYAVDTQPKYLDFIRRRSEREGLNNIVLVKVMDIENKLPEAGLDLVFARNVFHHLPAPAASFQNLRKFLKPGGRVVIIEHRPKKGFGFVSLFKHHTSVQTIIQEMDKAGFRLLSSADFLPDQTFNVFGPKPPR
jgi:arsenite methyltransferase